MPAAYQVGWSPFCSPSSSRSCSCRPACSTPGFRSNTGQLTISTTPTDLRSFILELKERLGAVDGGERIGVEAPEGLPPVSADPDHLERILMNLMTNAVKYSAPHMGIKVTLTTHDGEVGMGTTFYFTMPVAK